MKNLGSFGEAVQVGRKAGVRIVEKGNFMIAHEKNRKDVSFRIKGVEGTLTNILNEKYEKGVAITAEGKDNYYAWKDNKFVLMEEGIGK